MVRGTIQHLGGRGNGKPLVQIGGETAISSLAAIVPLSVIIRNLTTVLLFGQTLPISTPPPVKLGGWGTAQVFQKIGDSLAQGRLVGLDLPRLGDHLQALDATVTDVLNTGRSRPVFCFTGESIGRHETVRVSVVQRAAR